MAVEPGNVYQDDQSIPDDEIVYRMIQASNTKWSEIGEALRAGTNAFQDRRPEELEALNVPAVAVSVHLESEMRTQALQPEDLVERWGADKYGVASITAGDARELGQGVVRWPTSDHPDHGMIFVQAGMKKSNGQSGKLAKRSKIVIEPPR